MGDPGTVYLMYHELELPGRDLCQAKEGYARYVLTEADFRAQVASLKAAGYRGFTVSEGLEGAGEKQPGVVITFDDGCETDRICAVPILQEAGFHATFYVVAGCVGRRGYLSVAQLQELADAGFEIGCHSMTHAYLPDLDPDGLRKEIGEAKGRLEQWIGGRVNHFSCPGGRWNRRVAEVARAAGYHSVATSRIGTNSHKTDRFCLARVAVLRGTSLDEFAALCRGRLFLRRARDAVLGAAKSLLGNTVYEKVRSVVLDRG